MRNEAARAFLLGFPALFSIISPLSGAFIFFEVTVGRSPAERERLAKLVALYSLLVMLVALWGGSFVLAFFGISQAALRVAGGVVVAAAAWSLLHQPERREAEKQAQAAPTEGAEDEIALFPLTIPFTTGPGTIAVAISLGAERPEMAEGLLRFFLGMSAAAAGNAAVIWVAYRLGGQVARLLGPTGTRTVMRLFAFLLLCIGVQILIGGVQDVMGAAGGNR
ncbi:MAG TPA: MarC family protein [Acetobacteraceae bacterium]